eukprot:Clim_evm10s50 gene=Clim_evmTU10s50
MSHFQPLLEYGRNGMQVPHLRYSMTEQVSKSSILFSSSSDGSGVDRLIHVAYALRPREHWSNIIVSLSTLISKCKERSKRRLRVHVVVPQTQASKFEAMLQVVFQNVLQQNPQAFRVIPQTEALVVDEDDEHGNITHDYVHDRRPRQHLLLKHPELLGYYFSLGDLPVGSTGAGLPSDGRRIDKLLLLPTSALLTIDVATLYENYLFHSDEQENYSNWIAAVPTDDVTLHQAIELTFKLGNNSGDASRDITAKSVEQALVSTGIDTTKQLMPNLSMVLLRLDVFFNLGYDWYIPSLTTDSDNVPSIRRRETGKETEKLEGNWELKEKAKSGVDPYLTSLLAYAAYQPINISLLRGLPTGDFQDRKQRSLNGVFVDDAALQKFAVWQFDGPKGDRQWSIPPDQHNIMTKTWSVIYKKAIQPVETSSTLSTYLPKPMYELWGWQRDRFKYEARLGDSVKKWMKRIRSRVVVTVMDGGDSGDSNEHPIVSQNYDVIRKVTKAFFWKQRQHQRKHPTKVELHVMDYEADAEQLSLKNISAAHYAIPAMHVLPTEHNGSRLALSPAMARLHRERSTSLPMPNAHVDLVSAVMDPQLFCATLRAIDYSRGHGPSQSTGVVMPHCLTLDEMKTAVLQGQQRGGDLGVVYQYDSDTGNGHHRPGTAPSMVDLQSTDISRTFDNVASQQQSYFVSSSGTSPHVALAVSPSRAQMINQDKKAYEIEARQRRTADKPLIIATVLITSLEPLTLWVHKDLKSARFAGNQILRGSATQDYAKHVEMSRSLTTFFTAFVQQMRKQDSRQHGIPSAVFPSLRDRDLSQELLLFHVVFEDPKDTRLKRPNLIGIFAPDLNPFDPCRNGMKMDTDSLRSPCGGAYHDIPPLFGLTANFSEQAMSALSARVDEFCHAEVVVGANVCANLSVRDLLKRTLIMQYRNIEVAARNAQAADLSLWSLSMPHNGWDSDLQPFLSAMTEAEMEFYRAYLAVL